MKLFTSTFLVAIAGLMLIGCNNGGNSTTATETNLAGEVKIDGSSTVYPIAEAVAEEFRKVQPGVKVTVGLSGTGGGFKKFERSETDISNASRTIKAGEDSACKAAGITYTELMVAYDGLAVLVNPQNDWCKDITVAELKKIWEPEAQGKITKWNQVRKEWPDAELHLYGPGVESGTYDYFTEAIVGKSHSSRGDFTASEDDNVLVQGVAGDKYALGFFGFAYFEENMDKLKLVGVDDGNPENGEGAVIPSVETVKNKTYAPLSRPLFIYVNNKSLERAEVAAFTHYFIENAGTLSKEVGYIPLSNEEYAAQKSKLPQPETAAKQ